MKIILRNEALISLLFLDSFNSNTCNNDDLMDGKLRVENFNKYNDKVFYNIETVDQFLT